MSSHCVWMSLGFIRPAMSQEEVMLLHLYLVSLALVLPVTNSREASLVIRSPAYLSWVST